MPVMSYLAYPSKGQAEALERELGGLAGCELVAAEGRALFILVTDTVDEPAEQALQDRLRGLEGLEALMLVSAFGDDA